MSHDFSTLELELLKVMSAQETVTLPGRALSIMITGIATALTVAREEGDDAIKVGRALRDIEDQLGLARDHRSSVETRRDEVLRIIIQLQRTAAQKCVHT